MVNWLIVRHLLCMCEWLKFAVSLIVHCGSALQDTDCLQTVTIQSAGNALCRSQSLSCENNQQGFCSLLVVLSSFLLKDSLTLLTAVVHAGILKRQVAVVQRESHLTKGQQQMTHIQSGSTLCPEGKAKPCDCICEARKPARFMTVQVDSSCLIVHVKPRAQQHS